jgi:hypothetical protein
LVRDDSPDLAAARWFAATAAETVPQAPAFAQLDAGTRAALLRDLDLIRRGLSADDPAGYRPADDPYAFALDTPADRLRRRLGSQSPPPAQDGGTPAVGPTQPRPPVAATETLAGRAGALSDEIDFPGFVAGLIHGTFDAIVEASIRQMEAFAGLVAAVAKDVDRFTRENVSSSHVRSWLAEQHPGDLALDPGQRSGLRVRQATDPDEEPPAWLADYGLGDQQLTDELVEEELVPAARQVLGEQRLQMLAAMVLMGMNRVVVRDGTISARVRFRAAAADRLAVDYAAGDESASGGWGSRGAGPAPRTFVSTVGVNAQAESELKAELFGQVTLNVATETLPLDRFADAAQLVLLQRNARWAAPAAATPPVAAAPPVVATPPVAPPAAPVAPPAAPAPAPPAPAPATEATP